MVWGLLSARVGVLPVVVAQEPSQCGRPPKGGSFLALGLGAAVSLIGAVGLSLCVCLSGYLWGWEGRFVLSLLFLASGGTLC